MTFTLLFLANLSSLLMDGAPLFIGLGLIISILAVATGRLEGWNTADSLYFGFITATTVGFGDMVPRNGWGKLFSIGLSMIGLILTGIMIALAVEAAHTTYNQLNA